MTSHRHISINKDVEVLSLSTTVMASIMSTSSSFSAHIILLLGILQMFSSFRFGLGDGKDLYEASDPGLTLLNASNFKTIVHNSPNAWMVEFYSSWCGHCIRFAPTFKQIAKDVQKWSNVISVAAIDCAQEGNMPICRDYEIMGYPSIKFFLPQAPISNRGVLRKGHSYEQNDIKGEMLVFVENIFINHTNDKELADGTKKSTEAIDQPTSSPLLDVRDTGQGLVPISHGDAVLVREAKLTKSEKDTTRRRYTVFMHDLEKAMLYSLLHEVAQHATIKGESLNALKNYIDALTTYFPARQTSKVFLMELRTWIMGHNDAVQGVDLSKAIVEIKSKLKAFSDTYERWIGCAGSTYQYGNYPCGLWMMWHAMTVNQAALLSKSDDPKAVLKAMEGFVEHFFGCQECTRHFLEMSENGKAIEQEVKNADDAILWLWKAHNVVNTRLSGDISDDSAYPKEQFPNRQHCSHCYKNRVAGSDSWQEFRIKSVLRFLQEMYAMDNFDSNGMGLMDQSEHGQLLALADSHIDADNASTGFSSVFIKTHARLMFILYLVSSSLICLMCVRFLVQRRLVLCLRAFAWKQLGSF